MGAAAEGPMRLLFLDIVCEFAQSLIITAVSAAAHVIV